MQITTRIFRIATVITILLSLLMVGKVLAESSTADFSASTIKYAYKEKVTTFWGSKDEPVSVQVGDDTIWASYLEYYQDTGKVIASDGVKLKGTDPELTLTCAKLEADQNVISASGEVTFDYAEFSGKAGRLNYDQKAQKVVLEDNPVVETANGRITGKVIEIDLKTETITASGGSNLHLEEVENLQ